MDDLNNFSFLVMEHCYNLAPQVVDKCHLDRLQITRWGTSMTQLINVIGNFPPFTHGITPE
jgi:hypothetical protein